MSEPVPDPAPAVHNPPPAALNPPPAPLSPPAPPDRGRIIQVGKDNGALIASAAGFLFLAIKVLLVSHLSVHTALAILDASGPAAVVVGTLLTNLSAFLGFAALLLLYAARGRAGLWAGEIVLIAAIVIAAAVVPWTEFAIVAGAVLLGGLVQRWRGRTVRRRLDAVTHELVEEETEEAEETLEGPRATPAEVAARSEEIREDVAASRGLRRELARLGDPRWRRWAPAVLITAGLAVFLLNDDPWLPREAIVVAGEEPIVGYVLKEDLRVTAVLRDHDRRFLRLDTESVRERSICTGDRPPQRSLLEVLLSEAGSAADYPRCSSFGGDG